MGQFYEIGLQAGKNVTKKVNELLASEEGKLNFKVDKIVSLDDGSTVFHWSAVWNPHMYSVERKLLEILKETPDDNDEDNAYKLLCIGNEGGYDKYCNELGDELFDGLYNGEALQFPSQYYESPETRRIREIRGGCDSDIAEEVMAKVLTSDNILTHEMFESLCDRYVNSSEEFKHGMNAALVILLENNLYELACMVEKEQN